MLGIVIPIGGPFQFSFDFS